MLDKENEWDASFRMTLKQAREVIGKQFPHLLPLRIQRLGEGWDNVVFQVNYQYVFRFPRRNLGVECLRYESKILPKLPSDLPLKIPSLRFLGQASDIFPWPFLGYDIIQGDTSCQLHLSDKEREDNLVSIMSFLRELHSLDKQIFSQSNAPYDTLKRLDISSKREKAIAHLKGIQEMSILPSVEPLLIRLERSCERAKRDRDIALVHGDLYSRHLVCNSTRQVVGVIDWGDIHLGEPAVDLALIHSFFPPSLHSMCMNAYGPISEGTWHLARVRSIFHSAVLVLYSFEVKDHCLLQEALRSLHWIASQPES